MYPYDADSRLQLARERAAELAREYDRARREAPRASRRRRRAPAVALLRALRPSRRPAYRA